MNAKRFYIYLGSICLVTVLFTASVILFIHYTNDHQECSYTIRHEKDVAGNTHEIKQHICAERFHI